MTKRLTVEHRATLLGAEHFLSNVLTLLQVGQQQLVVRALKQDVLGQTWSCQGADGRVSTVDRHEKKMTVMPRGRVVAVA